MRRIDDLIDHLETRRMSIAEYKALWCTACLRCSLNDPAVRKSFVLLDAGEENCRQPLSSGTISECIRDFRACAGGAD